MNIKYENQYLIKPDGVGGRADTKLAVEHTDEEVSALIEQGYYLINSEGFNKLIGNAGEEYLLNPDGSITLKPPPTEEELLVAAKPAKIAKLKSERDTREVEPIEYSGNSYDYDDKARDRISAAIIALDAQGERASIAWTTADNHDVVVTADDLRAVVAAVAVRSNALHIAYREAKDKVAAAATVAEVEAVTLGV